MRGKGSMKRLTAMGLSLLLALGLTACGGLSTGDAQDYVQGILDMTYLGQFNEEYMKLVDVTEEECQENYQAGLETEAEYFAYYFQSYLTDEMRQPIVEMYQEIYSHSKYEITDAGKAKDGGFTVTVQVEPIDIFTLVMESDFDSYVDQFNARVNAGEFDAMSDDEFESEWLRGVIALVESKMDQLGHLETKSIVVQVQRDEEGVYGLNEDDFGNLDMLIIDYPA